MREGRSPSEADVAKTLRELIAAATGPRRGDDLRVQRRAHAGGRARPRRPPAARSWWSAARWTASRRSRARCGYLDGIAEFRSVEAYGYLPPDKVVALCTGSQGEPRAALARISEDQHPEVTSRKGDLVIFSSRTIPGNEKAVGKVINGLVRQGIEVITDRTHLVHVSGHPRRAEMEELYRWVQAEASRFPCTARRCISPSTPSSRAPPASARSCCAATAIWCSSRRARPA